MARIPNYKVNASIFKLFDSNSEGNPATETDSRFYNRRTRNKKTKIQQKEDKKLK